MHFIGGHGETGTIDTSPLCVRQASATKSYTLLSWSHGCGRRRNLLVNSNCDLKICDYGLARGTFPEEDL
eukprot:5827744-Amphidinium_carterae.1